MSTPAVSPPSPSDLLDVAEAALSSTFGTEFDLWAMGEGCLRPVGPRAQAATGEGRERALALEDQVQSRLMAAADPLVFKQDDDRFLVGLPLGGSRGETLLATATLEACPEAILLKTANLLLSDLDLRRELQQCRHDLDACAIQIGNDFEELTFLRRLAESLDLSDLSQGLWDLAKIVLPQLARMIRTELLALVAAGAAAGQPNLGQSLAATVIVADTVVAVVGLALAVQVRRQVGTLDVRALSSLKK